MYCIVFLIEQAEELATINYVTDNQKVADVYNGGPQAGAESSNCDLFNKLFQLCIAKGIILNVRWMPSHLKLTDDRPPGISDTDMMSNGHADEQAGFASLECKVPTDLANEYSETYDLASIIRKRILAIVRNLPARDNIKSNRIHRDAKPTVAELISKTEHSLQHAGIRYIGIRCHSGALVGVAL